LGVTSIAAIGGLGFEGMKEGLKGWIGFESAGCTFCDVTLDFIFLSLF
jgi:hypothetical protein